MQVHNMLNAQNMNSIHILWPIRNIPTLIILSILHSSVIWRRHL